jgi:hypothetical protein
MLLMPAVLLNTAACCLLVCCRRFTLLLPAWRQLCSSAYITTYLTARDLLASCWLNKHGCVSYVLCIAAVQAASLVMVADSAELAPLFKMQVDAAVASVTAHAEIAAKYLLCSCSCC